MGNMNNFPLRGCKGGYFDGGMRGVGLIHGAGLRKTGYVSNHLHHVVDWMPTLLTAAKQGALNDETVHHKMTFAPGERPFLPGDGIDNWVALSTGASSARNEIMHVVQAEGSYLEAHAYRRGDMKVLWHPAGTDCSKTHPGWYPPPGRTVFYANFTVKCPPPPQSLDACSVDEPCLFNISADPCEHKNLAKDQPELVSSMAVTISEYRQHAILPWLNFVHKNPDAKPSKHGPDTDGYQGVATPWLTSEQEAAFYPTKYDGPGYPAQLGSNCSQYEQMWLPSDGHSILDHVDANTTSDGCCKICAERPGCLSAVWWEEPSYFYKAGACVLHKHTGPRVAWTQGGKRTTVVPYGQGIASARKIFVI